MFKFVKKLFDYNQKEINRLRKKVDEINDLEDKVRKLKDKDFVTETKKLQDQVQSGKKELDEILPWAFALVREAARRTIGQRHYDVQLIAGLVLYEGKIAEQKTGEGKTLSATTALYTHALAGKGTHLVTVNDYLARRDAGWMGAIFEFLGLKTSAMISEQSFIYDSSYKDKQASDWRLYHLKPITRQEAYQVDITYGINSEFGFDYLRDNMESRLADLRQREYYYAIIDEADSVLIDEARTPHIISAPHDRDTSKYYQYAQIVKKLEAQKDYIIDEKLRTANLTEQGITAVESLTGISNIYERDFDTVFHIEAALKAETLFKIDKDYIIRDGEIVIVDEFTGRLLFGRRFSEGIHQAIEAKENVAIKRESRNLATVSLQNYFRMYKRLAGMTGTAATEAEEFHKIYKTDVLIVPTHRDMVRKDHPDMIYKTEKGKFNAVIDDIVANYKVGRPVLVGTTSIEKNEHLSGLLTKRGIPHELLNAKNHEQEAQIIARAGEKGAITVATNVAGRGVDIILGGESPSEFEEKLNKKEIEKWQKKHDEVIELGGLYILGTERHESRRIDNQLRGRSGRQGDPGETRFYVALDDDLMRIFGGEQISNLMTFFKFPEDQPLTHSMVSKAIEQAQVKVEGFNFDIRKNLVQYDDVLNKQREIVYSLRQDILKLLEKNLADFKTKVFETLNEEVSSLISQHSAIEMDDKEGTLLKELNLIHNFWQKDLEKYIKSKDYGGLTKYVESEIKKEYDKREKTIGREFWNSIVQSIFLTTIDRYWTEHLTAIDDLREGIGLRGYAQLDPLIEYKNEAFSMFERLLSDIYFEITRRIFRVEVQIAPQKMEEPKKEKEMIYQSASGTDPYSQKKKTKAKKEAVEAEVVSSSPISQDLTTFDKDESQVESVPTDQPYDLGGFKVTPPGAHSKKTKLGRNDPCPCGSGKKWKKCHYPDIP